MSITIDGTTGISGNNGSASTPAIQGEDTNTGVFFPAADTVAVATAGTERMRVDSSGNVGIGTSSPAAELHVNSGLANLAGLFESADAGASITLIDNSTTGGSVAEHGLNTVGDELEVRAVSALAFETAATERARIDSSGNLMVGTTTAQSSSANRGNITVGGSAGSIVNWASASSRLGYIFHDGSNMQINNNTGGYLNFYTSDIERARIDSSGNLLVGTTNGGLGATNGVVIGPTESSWTTDISAAVPIRIYNKGGSGTRYLMEFRNSSSGVGAITHNGTNTTYSTSSDYRLKENVAPMQNALDTVAQLNPVTYTWKADGSAGQGFIAHELQAVVPDCVTGEKDAVDADGKPKYQGVDTSFLVATLVKAIQEQQATITDLTARVAELEAR